MRLIATIAWPTNESTASLRCANQMQISAANKLMSAPRTWLRAFDDAVEAVAG